MAKKLSQTVNGYEGTLDADDARHVVGERKGPVIRQRLGWKRGLPLARAGARRVRAERWEMPLWGEVGWNFRRGLPQGFRGKTPFLKLFADAAVSC